MRTIVADSTDTKVRQLIQAAATEPVTVMDNGEPAAVVLSPAEFARLDHANRIRQEAKARLLATLAASQAEATARGLTEAELERLLADES